MIYEPEDGPTHIVPVNDSREHELTKDCWCNPYMDEACLCGNELVTKGEIWIHNAADGREQFETGIRKVS